MKHPATSNLGQAFLRDFGIAADLPPRELLGQVATSFARLPYENLTKIIADEAAKLRVEARRTPEEVLADHQRHGTGGTCFSLTATLRQVLLDLGFAAEPILADRHYGADTHCALVVDLDGQPHLLDPGFLLTTPVPLAKVARSIATPFHQVDLTPQAGGAKLELATVQEARRQTRLTYKLEPVDEARFGQVWDSSFEWEMMRYPLLSAVSGGEQLYLRGTRWQKRDRQRVHQEALDPRLLALHIEKQFGIARRVTEEAMAIWSRRGERHDRAPAA